MAIFSRTYMYVRAGLDSRARTQYYSYHGSPRRSASNTMQCQATLPLLLPLLPPPPLLLLRLISHSHHASMIFFGVGVSRGASGVGLRPLVERSRADPQGAADIWCMDGDGAEQTQSSQIKSRTPQNGLLLRELEDARRRRM